MNHSDEFTLSFYVSYITLVVFPGYDPGYKMLKQKKKKFSNSAAGKAPFSMLSSASCVHGYGQLHFDFVFDHFFSNLNYQFHA